MLNSVEQCMLEWVLSLLSISNLILMSSKLCSKQLFYKLADEQVNLTLSSFFIIKLMSE